MDFMTISFLRYLFRFLLGSGILSLRELVVTPGDIASA
jgi:hypothetical protein